MTYWLIRIHFYWNLNCLHYFYIFIEFCCSIWACLIHFICTNICIFCIFLGIPGTFILFKFILLKFTALLLHLLYVKFKRLKFFDEICDYSFKFCVLDSFMWFSLYIIQLMYRTDRFWQELIGFILGFNFAFNFMIRPAHMEFPFIQYLIYGHSRLGPDHGICRSDWASS